mgnify:FL=1
MLHIIVLTIRGNEKVRQKAENMQISLEEFYLITKVGEMYTGTKKIFLRLVMVLRMHI